MLLFQQSPSQSYIFRVQVDANDTEIRKAIGACTKISNGGTNDFFPH